jgi:Reverse transcriptase (RNA-dependent DNA polymerase)
MKAAGNIELFEPNTFKVAMQLDAWKPAILEEYQSLMENDTWEVVPLPPNRKAIKCRWIFSIKPGYKETPLRRKARLVAKGYTKKQGIDYEETYAPVVKYDPYGSYCPLSLHQPLIQLDVKTAFLYGVVKEELKRRASNWKGLCWLEENVCRLKKCLFGTSRMEQ